MEEQSSEIEIKAGDELVVIIDAYLPGNDEGPQIKNGQRCLALVVHKCGCGDSHISIAVRDAEGTVHNLVSHLNYVTCYKCRDQLPNSAYGGVHWCHSSRFAIYQRSETSSNIVHIET